MTMLLLAGTAEARTLSRLISERTRLITSLAGATDDPKPYGGDLRVGGFGGVDGLAGFLRDRGVDLILDATHPFATQMSSNARRAADICGCDYLHLLRPEWPVATNWTMVPDLAAASRALPSGATVFLATGRGSIRFFTHRHDVSLVVRVIDDRPGAFPGDNGRFLVSQPPFTVAEEVQTLRENRIDVLVSRNSGGTGGTEKLIAARDLGIPVIMARRPDYGPSDRVETVEAAMTWLKDRGWLDAS